MIRVLDPRAFPVEVDVGAPSVASLDGLTVGLLWNNRPRGDVILNGLAPRARGALRRLHDLRLQAPGRHGSPTRDHRPGREGGAGGDRRSR